jgi:L-ascorbate metabolism protein UlaG (beta-lactamase superfamily)
VTTIGKNVTITWVGHGTFHITTPEGRNLLIDAWVDGNPVCPEPLKAQVRQNLEAILLTHGHFDHIGDVVDLARESGAKVVCQYDMVPYLEGQGCMGEQLIGFNKGGTVEIAGVRATMTTGHHSSTIYENGQIINLGTTAGYVLRFSNDFTIYHAGDTCVTLDMQLIGELYRPDLAIVPIGDHFTMGPREAAYALKLIGARYAIPEHYGTFPILTGTPEQLQEYCNEFGVTTEIIALKPGEAVS